ncbi:MAG: FKBP-type peptidyl-prolyl cis-trans isomerase [Proteobacteria bacterium]|nr:FKBP-type peptidyl-prolyl cis-trans isomerase [Pseudomonadota bacterium]MBU1716071.1 FKBP-type peptidyl-prolyl cis-trans isomerase [Pseudomonadota bacterium]
MQKAKKDDFVTVTYEGLLRNGDVFETADDTGPLHFQLGQESVMSAFEKGIIGMAIGQTKTVEIKAKDAYGEKKDDLIISVPRASLGDNIAPQPGMVLGLTIEKDGQNHKVPAMILELTGDKVKVDFNHPLAGEPLTYKITLQSIGPQEAA